MDIIRAHERGSTKAGWLNSYHTFSFNRYYDPQRMGFGHVKVFNDDWIAPGKGFGTHHHENMEIITFVLNGAVEHEDSSGGGGVIRFGEVQVMSAGSGITHSEFNHSISEPLELFQIWIDTKKVGIKPRYDQKKFNYEKNALNKLVGGKKGDPLFINQDCEMFYGEFDQGARLEIKNGSLVFIIDGEAKCGHDKLYPRDTLLAYANRKLDLTKTSRLLLLKS